MSLDEFVITYFIIGAQITLPIYIYTQIKFGITPAINAVATLLIVGSLWDRGPGRRHPAVDQDGRPRVACGVRAGATGAAGRRRSHGTGAGRKLDGPIPYQVCAAHRRPSSAAALPAFDLRGGGAVDSRTRSSTGTRTWRGAIVGRSIRSSSRLTARSAWNISGWDTVVSAIRFSARDRDVVEADDGYVGRDSQPDRLARVDQTDRADVV